MKAIPSELNLDALIGQRLMHISLAEHNLQFHFEESISIQGDGTVTVIKGGIEKRMNGDNGLFDSSPVAEILSKTVVSWEKKSSHCLSISLENDTTLLFTSEDSPYEDFIVEPIGIVW